MPLIAFDFSYFYQLSYLPPWVVAWRFFLSGGWIPFVMISAWGFWKMWKNWRENLYAAKLKIVLLAIDIPKETEQTPKAVENMFAHLAGTIKGLNAWEKYWLGEFVLPFSFEIISIDGHIQFLVRSPAKHRNLVEAIIYAQYPDAEITEVEDYTNILPLQYPDPEYELFGTEFILAKKQFYPIRTYLSFEDKLVGELKDPLSSVLEVMTRLRPGEQLWLQMIIIPAKDDWKEVGEKEAKKLAGHTLPVKKTVAGTVIGLPHTLLSTVVGQVIPGGSAAEKQEMFPRALLLTTGERDIIAAIQMKASKPGFRVKFRVVYLAKKDVFKKGPVYTISGALKQFAALNLNNFKMYSKVTPKFDYWYQRLVRRSKQRKLARAYKFRSPQRGAPLYILNTEELATLYHFPSIFVKTPLLQKTEAKRAEPPMGIPFREEEEPMEEASTVSPSNLPIV